MDRPVEPLLVGLCWPQFCAGCCATGPDRRSAASLDKKKDPLPGVRQGIKKPRPGLGCLDGAKRIRTADPLHAMQVLYQLSYGPEKALWQR